MSFQQIIDKINQLEPPSEVVPDVPPLEVTAFFVRWVRRLQQWKVSTLASFAGVSVSTIERVERGEKVSAENFDRIAVALGYERGYFTSPRCAIPAEQAQAELLEAFSNLEVVTVSRFKTQKQVREAGGCQAFLLHHPNVPAELEGEIRLLGEWLDLVSYVRSTPSSSFQRDGSKRALYGDVLDCVSSLEKAGLTVLLGTMPAPQDGIPEWKMAIVSVTPRNTDPGAMARTRILVDRRCAQVLPPMPTAS
jgi:transcriptional regulator with XRE-family HTH domain